MHRQNLITRIPFVGRCLYHLLILLVDLFQPLFHRSTHFSAMSLSIMSFILTRLIFLFRVLPGGNFSMHEVRCDCPQGRLKSFFYMLSTSFVAVIFPLKWLFEFECFDRELEGTFEFFILSASKAILNCLNL